MARFLLIPLMAWWVTSFIPPPTLAVIRTIPDCTSLLQRAVRTGTRSTTTSLSVGYCNAIYQLFDDDHHRRRGEWNGRCQSCAKLSQLVTTTTCQTANHHTETCQANNHHHHYQISSSDRVKQEVSHHREASGHGKVRLCKVCYLW